MLCPKCGATLPEEIKYCAFCGTPHPDAKLDTEQLFREKPPSAGKDLSIHVLISTLLAVCGAAFGLFLFLSDIESMSSMVVDSQYNDYLIFSILLLIIAVTFTVMFGISIALLMMRRKIGAKLVAITHLLFGSTLFVHRISLLFFYWGSQLGNPFLNDMLAYVWPIIPAILLIGAGVEEMIRNPKIIETLE